MFQRRPFQTIAFLRFGGACECTVGKPRQARRTRGEVVALSVRDEAKPHSTRTEDGTLLVSERTSGRCEDMSTTCAQLVLVCYSACQMMVPTNVAQRILSRSGR